MSEFATEPEASSRCLLPDTARAAVHPRAGKVRAMPEARGADTPRRAETPRRRLSESRRGEPESPLCDVPRVGAPGGQTGQGAGVDPQRVAPARLYTLDGRPMTCSRSGCRRPHQARGLCHTHYEFQRRHGGFAPLPSADTRFLAQLQETLSGCLEWCASGNGAGYGKFRVDGRQVYAHRYAWERMHGPIPRGLLACHICDNPRCVNVAHLFLGTHADNQADKTRKGRHHASLRMHCPQGHPYDERNTVRRGGGRRCRTCLNAHRRAKRASRAATS